MVILKSAEGNDTESISVAELLVLTGSVVPLGAVIVAIFDTLPLVAVTFALIVNVTTPPFGKVGITKPLVDSLFAMVRFAAVGKDALFVAEQVTEVFVNISYGEFFSHCKC